MRGSFGILLFDELELLSRMRDHLHVVDNLAQELLELLVPFFDLFVESLVLNLQLLEVDDVQAIS